MQRSSVELLPEDVRKELEQKLIQGGFSDYVGLAEWLNEKGFEISKSSIHRYGQKFEERVEALKVATEQAKAIVETSEDDAGAMNEAIIRLVQTKTFELLREMEVDKKSLPKIGQMVAKLGRAAVQQKKWNQEMEEKVRKRALEEAAKTVEQSGKQAGASPETIRAIHRDILRISEA
ncbi:MAG: DUF3486 family protein [Desulfobacteraceae bacterium]